MGIAIISMGKKNAEFGRTANAFIVLAGIVQKTMVREMGTPNIDLNLINSIAWDVAERLAISLYVPTSGSQNAAKAEQPDGQPLRATISPARREIFRQNSEDCGNPKKHPDSVEKLETMYRSHVSELLDEVERLEFLLERIATEYLADKAALQDKNRELSDKLVHFRIMRDVFDKPTDKIREDRLSDDSK